MAVAAIELPVAAVQYKPRVARVVKARIAPADRAVAILALLAALALVDVVIGMAARTRRRRILKRLIFVTTKTSGIEMLANQRKTGHVMFEFHVEPAGWRMAVAALGAQVVLMHVIGFVTAMAVLRRFPVSHVGFVALIALRICMRAEQSEVGVAVIEGKLVELQDVGVAAFMIGVTAVTGAFTGSTEAAVKAGTGVNVGRNLFVTIKTQFALLTTLE